MQNFTMSMLFMAFLVALAPLAQADDLIEVQANALLPPQIETIVQH